MVAIIFSASCIHFVWQTANTRYSNTDDVAFAAAARSAQADQYLLDNAQSQARFYLAAPFYRHVLLSPYTVESTLLFSGLRGVLLYAQAGMLGWLATRIWGNAPFGAAVALLVVATLHLPATFFPVLSYFGLSAGFLALLAALHAQLAWLRRGHPLAALLAACSFLLSCLTAEYFVVFLPAFLLLALAERNGSWRTAMRATLLPGLVASGYLVLYAAFAREFASAYAGTQFSFDLRAAGGVLLRQLAGMVPGFELAVQRLPEGQSGALFRPIPEITADLASGTGLLIGLAHGGVILGLLHSAWRERARPACTDWPWLGGLVVLANAPLMISAKYQTFIFHRQYPYVYAFYAFCLAGWMLASVVIGCADSRPRFRPVLAASVAALILAACVSAQFSNARTLNLLHARFNGPSSSAPGLFLTR